MVRALSRADSGRRAGTEGPRAGVLLCRPARRRAAAPGTAPPGSLQRRRPRRTEAIQPLPPHRRKVSPGSVQDARYPGPGRPSTWRAPARRSSLGTDRRWSPSDAAQDRVSTRTRPAAGTKCRRVGQRQRRRAPHSRSSSARPNSWRHPARPGRYREPSPDTALAGRQSLFRNRPVAGRRCRTGALGAVAGTADAKACVRGAGGGVLAFSRPADYLYSLLPASPSRGSSVSRADSVRRGRPEVMDGIDAGAPDDRGCRPLPYRTGGSGL